MVAERGQPPRRPRTMPLRWPPTITRRPPLSTMAVAKVECRRPPLYTMAAAKVECRRPLLYTMAAASLESCTVCYDSRDKYLTHCQIRRTCDHDTL